MRRESPIHAIVNPPDKQSSNNNSSCAMKEALTNILQQLKYLNWYEDIQSWRFGNLTPRRCCHLIDFKRSIPVETHGIKFLFFFPNLVEITVAVEPYESVYVGHLTFELIWYSLCSVMMDDLLESIIQSCYNKKNKQTNKEVEFGIRVQMKDRRWIRE